MTQRILTVPWRELSQVVLLCALIQSCSFDPRELTAHPGSDDLGDGDGDGENAEAGGTSSDGGSPPGVGGSPIGVGGGATGGASTGGQSYGVALVANGELVKDACIGATPLSLPHNTETTPTYLPDSWGGDYVDMTGNACNSREGCTSISYTPMGTGVGYASIIWTEIPKQTFHCLGGATAVTFFARGTPGATVKFFSLDGEMPLTLTDTWSEYQIVFSADTISALWVHGVRNPLALLVNMEAGDILFEVDDVTFVE